MNWQQLDPHESPRTPDNMFSTDAVIKATSKEVKVLKWHRITGHLGTQSAIRVARNCKGMEELVGISQKILLPVCNCCRRSKSKGQNHRRDHLNGIKRSCTAFILTCQGTFGQSLFKRHTLLLCNWNFVRCCPQWEQYSWGVMRNVSCPDVPIDWSDQDMILE